MLPSYARRTAESPTDGIRYPSPGGYRRSGTARCRTDVVGSDGGRLACAPEPEVPEVAAAGRDSVAGYGAVDVSTNSTVSYDPLVSTLTPGGGVPKPIRRPSPLSISWSSVP